MRYLATCECDPEPIVFEDPTTRDQWAQQHWERTGHGITYTEQAEPSREDTT